MPFSHVVLIARNGTPIYSAAFGQADREHNVPNTIDTRFNLGSMNKMWTAIAIAQLVERGKIDLDATVGRYVPDLPNQSIRETVKIRHLLSHTSGMGSHFRKGFLRNKTYAATAAGRPQRRNSRRERRVHDVPGSGGGCRRAREHGSAGGDAGVGRILGVLTGRQLQINTR